MKSVLRAPLRREKPTCKLFGALAVALALAAAPAAQANEARILSGDCGGAMELLVSFDAAGVSTRLTRGFARAEALRLMRDDMARRAYALAMTAATGHCQGRRVAIEIAEMPAEEPVCVRRRVRTIHGPRRGLECRVRGAQAAAMALMR